MIKKCDVKYNTAINHNPNFCKHVNCSSILLIRSRNSSHRKLKKRIIILKVKTKAEVIQSELKKKHLDIYVKG